MTEKTPKVNVQIKYKDTEQQFTAEPQEAWLLLNKFFKELIPSFEIAQKLTLNIDLQQLAKDLQGIIAFSDGGISLLAPKNKLTDNETLMIWLTAHFLGNKLCLVNNDSLSKEELQAKLGKSGKITSTRLGELIKNDFVARTAADKYRITNLGIVQSQKEVIPKVKSKIN
ncbi:MAG: hypothetical protein NWE95_08325 [Candidatus Bathyarchaeota archaeon]|nr:hypothetical protein [Candidatus Bathyarchaeota archaeon]